MWIPHLCSNCVAPFPSIIKTRLPDYEKTTPQRRSPLLLQMQNLGIISNLVNGLSSPELLLPSPVRPQWSLMNDYDLLFCLRRDSNKVQSYLKILKCRIVPENDCWSPKERETAHSQTPFANHFNGDEWVTMPDRTLVKADMIFYLHFQGFTETLVESLDNTCIYCLFLLVKLGLNTGRFDVPIWLMLQFM